MSYIVRWFKDETVVAESRFENLHKAKQSARSQLSTYRERSGATNAVVCDDKGTVYFRMY